MNRLEAWAADELIEVFLPEPAYEEALAGGNPNRTRKARTFLQTLTYANTPPERDELRRIEEIVFPGGARDEGQRHDIEIVFNAGKYGARLVTADGLSKRQPVGILGAADALRRLGIHVMSDVDAVALVEDQIRRRDRLAREWAAATQNPLPSWVGREG